jgi:large subunit ribosomal protein L24
MAPVAPTVAARLDAIASPGAARVDLALELGKSAQTDRVSARAVIGIDAPQLKGSATLTAAPMISALRSGDVAALGRSDVGAVAKLTSERGASLLALLGLDHIIAAGKGPADFDGTASGIWGGALRLNAKISGGQIDAELQGSAEPWVPEPKASGNLTLRRGNLAPLFDLPESEATASTVTMSSRLTLAGRKLTFDDIDSAIGGSRLRGRIALTSGDDTAIEGEIGLDTLEFGPAVSLAIGAAGRDGSAPLRRGLLQGWRGRVAFQALRCLLPGGSELRPVSGVIASDGQSLTLEALKGSIGGGEAKADLDVRRSADGVTLNARLQFASVDGSALRYRGLSMPPSLVGAQMTISSAGRSASALAGALSGDGLLTLESARVAGLDPKAFEAAIRSSDAGNVGDDLRLRQIVEPILSAGSLPVATAQLPFSVRDGRISVTTTTLESAAARATVSGGYDFIADQADLRANLVSIADRSTTLRPELQVFAVGPPDRLERSVDVAALSSWLAVRAIDRETRKFEALERGGLPPASPASVSPTVDPATDAPTASTPPGSGLNPPASAAPLPQLRRIPAKPKLDPRPAAMPQARAPVTSDQVAPLPPPIEIKPAPGATRQPRLRPPMVLTPSGGNPPRAGF